MKLKQLAIGLTVGALLGVGAVREAQASVTYLPVVVSYGWPSSECTLCHTGTLGMAGTAVQPFAQTLKAEYGLVEMMPSAELEMMLQDMERRETENDNPIDSDGDGEFDIAELRGAGNPSDPTVLSGGLSYEVPEYGCLSVAPPSRPSSLPSLAAGLVALLLLRSARRRR